MAAIPGAGGQINGCYTTGGLQKGNVRIVDEGVACRNGETAISWNQKGKQGDAGPAGATGLAGVAGAKGDAGEKGEAGVAGAPGATGAPGTPGAKGDAGPAGRDGVNGEDGRDGAKGDNGVAGPAGPKGDTGAVGPAGPQGVAGPAGAPGIDALTLGGEALSDGTADAFLIIPGVKGESVDKDFKDAIELKSFQFKIENSVSFGSASGGAGAGKASFTSIHVTKLFDKSTPELLKAVTRGSHWNEASIVFRKRGGSQPLLTVNLKLVFVSSWEQGGKAEPPLLENVDFEAGTFSVSYAAQNPNGSVGSPVTYGWDRVRNTEAPAN